MSGWLRGCGWASGGPIASFAGGWARIPFSGEYGHFWRATGGAARPYVSSCGLAAPTAKPGVSPLGVGTGPLCRHCMRKHTPPTAAERSPVLEVSAQAGDGDA